MCEKFAPRVRRLIQKEHRKISYKHINRYCNICNIDFQQSTEIG